MVTAARRNFAREREEARHVPGDARHRGELDGAVGGGKGGVMLRRLLAGVRPVGGDGGSVFRKLEATNRRPGLGFRGGVV